jgi:histidine ammonia-lyase
MASEAAVPAVVLDGKALGFEQVERVARRGARVEISGGSVSLMARVRGALERAASDGEPHYGINTGFGSFSRERIAPAELRDLQRNLVRSHAAGVGAALDPPTVRATMLVLAASLCRGRSGVRPVVVETIAAFLNAGITPVVPEIGSVGASGDLAPLAHIALSLIGEGEVLREGRRVGTAAALADARIAPLVLEPKEGLALINGTHLMAGRLALLRGRFERLVPAALAGAAISLEACRATDAFLDPRVFEARNQPGPAWAAERMRGLLAGSEIIPSHDTPEDPRVQDPYSIRCAPYVIGAALEAAWFVWGALDRELGAVTDNPLVLPGTGDSVDIVSAGNFHGMPVAIPLDVLAIPLAHLAGIAERRIDQMLSAHDPETRLRPFLSPKPGLHSGLMIVQYTAAALCNEIAGLASPASVINIPTSAGIEDYNSFGPRAAAKAWRSLDLVERVVAAELLCAAQGLEAHRPLRSGAGVERAHGIVREKVPRLDADRPPSADIEAIAGLIADGRFSEPI